MNQHQIEAAYLAGGGDVFGRAYNTLKLS